MLGSHVDSNLFRIPHKTRVPVENDFRRGQTPGGLIHIMDNIVPIDKLTKIGYQRTSVYSGLDEHPRTNASTDVSWAAKWVDLEEAQEMWLQYHRKSNKSTNDGIEKQVFGFEGSISRVLEQDRKQKEFDIS